MSAISQGTFSHMETRLKIGRRPVGDRFNILVWDRVDGGQPGIIISHIEIRLKCRSSLGVRISKNPWYPNSISLLVSFCSFIPAESIVSTQLSFDCTS